ADRSRVSVSRTRTTRRMVGSYCRTSSLAASWSPARTRRISSRNGFSADTAAPSRGESDTPPPFYQGPPGPSRKLSRREFAEKFCPGGFRRHDNPSTNGTPADGRAAGLFGRDDRQLQTGDYHGLAFLLQERVEAPEVRPAGAARAKPAVRGTPGE